MRFNIPRRWFAWPVIVLLAVVAAPPSSTGELWVGATTVSITPDRPVALWGQMHTRISIGVESPVTATVLAIESRGDAASAEQAVLVACDLVAIPKEVLEKTRSRVLAKLPDFPVQKITS